MQYIVHMSSISYQYIKILVVRPCVCNGYIKILVVRPCVYNGCGRGHNEFTGRVQKHYVRFSFHKNGHTKSFLRYCWSGHSGLLATRRMSLWALAIALSTGKNTRLVGVLDQNRTRFFTYVSQRAESMQGTHCHDERLAWVASRWQGTSCSCSFVSKVL